MRRNAQPTHADGTPHHWNCRCNDCIRYDEWVSATAERIAEDRAYERHLEDEHHYDAQWGR